MVIDQGNKHPPLGGDEVVRVIVHPLPTDREVLPARQAVLVLVVTHGNLIPPLVKVPVGLVEEDIVLFQCHEELPLEACLPVDAVLHVPVVGVVVGGAGATPVRTICLKHGKIDLLHPGEEDVGDLIFPEVKKEEEVRTETVSLLRKHSWIM